MKPFFVYMLRCSDGSYYVGHTDDLEARIAQHGEGTLGGYTSSRRPLELVWCSELATRDEALQREVQLKRWSRAKKEALTRSDWSGLKRLARGPDRFPVHPSTPREPEGSRYARDERMSGTSARPAVADARASTVHPSTPREPEGSRYARDERSTEAPDDARDERSTEARDDARDERSTEARDDVRERVHG